MVRCGVWLGGIGRMVRCDSGQGNRSPTARTAPWLLAAGCAVALDCSGAGPEPGSRELRVEPAAGGFRLVNPDSSAAFFAAFEQQLTALVYWRPCTEPEGCRHVPAAGQLVLPFDSIPGYGPAADSATIFWWRRAPDVGGVTFDSVRSVTVGLRRPAP